MYQRTTSRVARTPLNKKCPSGRRPCVFYCFFFEMFISLSDVRCLHVLLEARTSVCRFSATNESWFTGYWLHFYAICTLGSWPAITLRKWQSDSTTTVIARYINRYGFRTPLMTSKWQFKLSMFLHWRFLRTKTFIVLSATLKTVVNLLLISLSQLSYSDTKQRMTLKSMLSNILDVFILRQSLNPTVKLVHFHLFRITGLYCD